MINKLVGFILLTLLMFTGISNATIFTVQDNIPDNTYLSGGYTSGYFNLNAVLPQNGQYVSPLDVVSASATFRFTDDNNDSYYAGQNQTGYQYAGRYDYNYYYYNYVYTYYNDVQEYVYVSAEGPWTYGETPYVGSNYSLSGSQLDAYYWNGYGYNVLYTYYYTNNTGNQGSFNVTISDSNLVSSISQDGVVNFTILTYGNLYLNSGTLTADINENPVATPEPATMLLLGLGLVGLAGIRKKMH